jgi:hypothetical protein
MNRHGYNKTVNCDLVKISNNNFADTSVGNDRSELCLGQFTSLKAAMFSLSLNHCLGGKEQILLALTNASIKV